MKEKNNRKSYHSFYHHVYLLFCYVAMLCCVSFCYIPWLFGIEGGPRLLQGVIKIGFVAFDPKPLFYPLAFLALKGDQNS